MYFILYLKDFCTYKNTKRYLAGYPSHILPSTRYFLSYVNLNFEFPSLPLLDWGLLLIVALILEAFLKRHIPMSSECLSREEEGEESRG